MIQTSNFHRRILLYLNISLLLGVLSWVALLIQAARHLKDLPAPVDHAITVGPLILGHLGKREVADGFSATISLGAGLAWYMLAWIIFGCLVAYGLEAYDRRQKA
jgi:hypothetical protein